MIITTEKKTERQVPSCEARDTQTGADKEEKNILSNPCEPVLSHATGVIEGSVASERGLAFVIACFGGVFVKQASQVSLKCHQPVTEPAEFAYIGVHLRFSTPEVCRFVSLWGACRARLRFFMFSGQPRNLYHS